MSNEYREWAKKNKICTNCFREKAFNGRTMCPECLDKNKERSEKTRTEASKEQRRKYIKRKRDLCVAFGICRECLKRHSVKGESKCLDCKVKQVKRNEAKRDKDKVKRNFRTQLSLCYFCGEKAIEGKKTCQKHYEIAGNNLKGFNRDNSKHIWRQIQSGEIKNLQHFIKLKGLPLSRG